MIKESYLRQFFTGIFPFREILRNTYLNDMQDKIRNTVDFKAKDEKYIQKWRKHMSDKTLSDKNISLAYSFDSSEFYLHVI